MSDGFNGNKAIYLQIADRICDKILQGKYPNNSKIQSIRDTAVALEVNPNTVQRAYEWLQQNDIIFTKRGLGYFTSEVAKTKVMSIRKQEFVSQVLPQVFKNMQLLNVDIKDVENEYITYVNKQDDENK